MHTFSAFHAYSDRSPRGDVCTSVGGESYFLVGVSFIGLGCRIRIDLRFLWIDLRFADRIEVLWIGWMQNFLANWSCYSGVVLVELAGR